MAPPALGPSHCPPRRVYVDLGVNWCNTLQLHDRVPLRWQMKHAGAELSARRAPWQVYGFEASPLIVPYADRCATALSRGARLPPPPVPPVGSGKELRRLGASFGCSAVDVGMDAAAAPWASRPKWKFRQALTGKQNRCLIRTLSKNLSALRPDPGLSNNLPLLRRRLDGASSCDRPGAHASYTFVPAAAGAHDGEMAVYGMPEDVLLGGISSTASGRPMGQKMTVPVVNIARWLTTSFTRSDFVVLKMDVEGAEASIIPALVDANATRLIDVFLWECHTSKLPRKPLYKRWPQHSKRTPCALLERVLTEHGVSIVYLEPYDFQRNSTGRWSDG